MCINRSLILSYDILQILLQVLYCRAQCHSDDSDRLKLNSLNWITAESDLLNTTAYERLSRSIWSDMHYLKSLMGKVLKLLHRYACNQRCSECVCQVIYLKILWAKYWHCSVKFILYCLHRIINDITQWKHWK